MPAIRTRRRRRLIGFTLVELLVVIAIIGVLISLLMPAVQSSREAARMTQCKNNLKQLAVAAHLYHDANKFLPGTRYSGHPDDAAGTQCGAGTPTWMIRVLPYIEESNFAQHWDLQTGWDLHDTEARNYAPSVYLCPSRRAGGDNIGATQFRTYTAGTKTETRTVQVTAPCGCRVNVEEQFEVEVGNVSVRTITGALGDYAGNHGDLSPGSTGQPTDFYYGGNGSGAIISVRPNCSAGLAVGPRDRVRLASVTDGTSSTFLFGEKYIPADELTKLPYDAPIYDGNNLSAAARLAGPGVRLGAGPTDLLATVFSFGSWHPGVTQFAMVDGSVRALANDTDTQTLGSMANREDARVVVLDR